VLSTGIRLDCSCGRRQISRNGCRQNKPIAKSWQSFVPSLDPGRAEAGNVATPCRCGQQGIHKVILDLRECGFAGGSEGQRRQPLYSIGYVANASGGQKFSAQTFPRRTRQSKLVVVRFYLIDGTIVRSGGRCVMGTICAIVRTAKLALGTLPWLAYREPKSRSHLDDGSALIPNAPLLQRVGWSRLRPSGG